MQSDKRLVKLFLRGVEPAFTELVNRYRSPLLNFAGAIAGRDRADDVVQDSLVKAHRALLRDEPDEVAAWLYRIVRNTALNDIRDNGKHTHEELGHAAGAVEQPHDVLVRRERLASVVAAVAELPRSQREAIVGRELGGFSHDEIAAQLDLSTGATKQLIYRARTSLREALGALIPFPLIAWLVADSAGVYSAGTAGGAAAGAAVGATSGGAGAGGATGLLAGIAGSGAAKVAVVAAIAGGSLAAGVAVEKQAGDGPGASASARPADAGQTATAGPDFEVTSGGSSGSGRSGSGGKDGDDDSGSRGGSDDRRGDDRRDDADDSSGSSGSGSSGSGRESDDDHGGSSGGSGSGKDDDGSESSGSGSGDDDRSGGSSRDVESPDKPEPPEYEPPEEPEPEQYEPPEDGDDSGGNSGGNSGKGSRDDD